jgi:hypothetical protein
VPDYDFLSMPPLPGARHGHDRTSLARTGDGRGHARHAGIGWALVGVGVLTTIPLALLVFGKRRRVV